MNDKMIANLKLKISNWLARRRASRSVICRIWPSMPSRYSSLQEFDHETSPLVDKTILSGGPFQCLSMAELILDMRKSMDEDERQDIASELAFRDKARFDECCSTTASLKSLELHYLALPRIPAPCAVRQLAEAYA